MYVESEPEQQEPTEISAELSLAIDYSAISDNIEGFKDTMEVEIASAAGVNVSRVNVTSVTEGSIVVGFTISAPPASESDASDSDPANTGSTSPSVPVISATEALAALTTKIQETTASNATSSFTYLKETTAIEEIEPEPVVEPESSSGIYIYTCTLTHKYIHIHIITLTFITGFFLIVFLNRLFYFEIHCLCVCMHT